jgi:outer membrane protein
MLRLCAALVSTLGVALTLPAAAAGPKLGVVDVQKVMEAIPAWAKAVESLKRDFEIKKNQLDGTQAELKKKQDQLEAKRSVTDPKAMEQEEKEFIAKAQAFQASFMSAQQEFAAREGKLKTDMLSRVEQMVNLVAQRGEYDFVFETGPSQQPNVLYLAQGMDLTAAVIEAYKQNFGDKPLAVAAPAPAAPKK